MKQDPHADCLTWYDKITAKLKSINPDCHPRHYKDENGEGCEFSWEFHSKWSIELDEDKDVTNKWSLAIKNPQGEVIQDIQGEQSIVEHVLYLLVPGLVT